MTPLVVTPAAQAVVIDEKAKQVLLPTIPAGGSGIVAVRVTELLGILPSSSWTMHWTPAPGTKVVGLPSCDPDNRDDILESIYPGGFSGFCRWELSLLTPYSRPYVHTLVLKADARASKGPQRGILTIDHGPLTGPPRQYSYLVNIA